MKKRIFLAAVAVAAVACSSAEKTPTTPVLTDKIVFCEATLPLDGKLLVGSFGSDEFNDHHFHYGYFTLSSGLLGAVAPDFRDAWREVHPKLPGYTWDIEKSRMAREESFPGEPSRRLDRVLFRSSHWTSTRAELLGTEPVSPKNKRLFPSDHFGLLVVFSRTAVSAISVDQRSSAVDDSGD